MKLLSILRTSIISLVAVIATVHAGDSTTLGTSAGLPMSLPTATEGTACSGVGRTAFTTTGLILSCQSGVWRSSSTVTSSLLAVNGYTSLSGGHTTQWGSATGTCFGFQVFYPIPFNSAAFSVVASASSSTAVYDTQVTSITRNSFVISSPGCTTGAAFNYRWHATGL